MTGTVVAFDEQHGLGTVRADDGRQFPFHSVRIADGTRAIAVGAPVTFEIVPGNLGRWEAASIATR